MVKVLFFILRIYYLHWHFLFSEKTIIVIENAWTPFTSKNIIVNIHFNMKHAQLTLDLHDGPFLFLDCKFVSNFPNKRNEDSKQCEKMWEEYVKRKTKYNSLTPEELEQRGMTAQEREEKKREELQMNNIRGDNARPAVVLVRGVCVMVNCQIVEPRSRCPGPLA